GVTEHSDFRDDPFARLRRTLAATYAVVFGTTPRADRAIRRMNAIHATVEGLVPESGEAYRALDPALLLWVHATLVDTAIRVYDRFVSPLSELEAESYYAEASLIAHRLGIPEAALPRTLADLRAEMERLILDGEVRVTPTARNLALAVLYPTRFPPRPVWDLAHLVSMSVLPSEIRRGYGIGWSPGRERGVELLAAASRRLLPLVPDPLRHVPAARSAERRLARASARW
ncbi:MAG: oxygenase MpaB family protein, partial [Chloroflexota bacterium]